MVNVGLVTCSWTPSARHAPRTKVVLPLPSSPATVTTSPVSSRSASPAASASVSSGEDVSVSGTRERLEEAELLSRVLRRGDERQLRHRRCGRLDRAAEQLRQAREIRLEHLQHRRRVQRGGRMVERVEQNVAATELGFLRLAVHACDPERAAREELRGEVAERGDDPRLDQLELAEEVRLARLDLVRLGVAVAWWAAHQHIRYEDVLTGQADAREQLLEQLARLPDERQALLVLVEPGRLAHEHQVRAGVPRAEHDLRASLRKAAARATGRGLGVRLELVRAIDRNGTHGPTFGWTLTAGESTTAPGRPSIGARARMKTVRPGSNSYASAADRDDAGAPDAARRLDLDLVADALAEDGAADGRLRRDAPHARDVERHQLAVVPLQLDMGPDGDDAARGGRLLVDHLGIVEARAQDRDPALEQALLVLRRVVLEVLGEVAVASRYRDRVDHRTPPRALQLRELCLELRALSSRELLPLVSHAEKPSGRSRRSRRSSRPRRRRKTAASTPHGLRTSRTGARRWSQCSRGRRPARRCGRAPRSGTRTPCRRTRR